MFACASTRASQRPAVRAHVALGANLGDATATVGETPAAAVAANAGEKVLALDALGVAVIGCCNQA